MRHGGFTARLRPGPCALLLLLLTGAGPLAAAEPEAVEGALQRSQTQAAASQQRVDQLDDATREALQEYRAALLQAEQLRLYERQLAAQRDTVQARLAEVDAALARLEESRGAMVPLLVRMADALEAFVEADQPFDLDARRARVAGLRNLLADPEAGLSEQYRGAYAAWQAEAAAGRTLAAERVNLPGSRSGQLVDLVRVGRLGLYALALDGSSAWVWRPQARDFVELPRGTVPALKQALRVAQEQAAPSLLTLPLEAPQ